MTTTFHLSADELNNDFLEKVKNTFGKKQLMITVEEDDDTSFVLSTKANREKLKKSLKEFEAGEVIIVPLEDLRK